MSNLVIAEYSDIVAIADAIREKTGETKQLTLNEMVEGIENIEVGGAAPAKTTRTIHINWDEDFEGITEVSYVSNGQMVMITKGSGIDTIEAEGGVIKYDNDFAELCYYTSNFIKIDGYGVYDHVLLATQDGETLYVVSTGEQGA